MLVCKEVFEKVGFFDESFTCCGEDYDLWIRANLSGVKFHFIDKPLAFYRIHDKQTTKNSLLVWQTYIHVIERYEWYNPPLVRKAVATHELNIAEYLLRNGQKAEGRQYLLKAIKNRPDRFWKGIRIAFLSYFMDGEKALERAGFNVPYTLKNSG